MSAEGLFQQSYGGQPDALFSAPGRVNLIGEHTDYSGGLVLPFAIDARAHLAVRRNDDDQVRVVSGQRPEAVHTYHVGNIRPGSPAATSWTGYLLGALWSLAQSGIPLRGYDLALDSSVPAGAGLSSSAAVECVTVLAAAHLNGADLTATDIAWIAQRAENDFVGVPCGPMDQMASAAAEEGTVLLFDTLDKSIEHVPFDPSASDLAILVIDTRVAHSLSDGEYGRRRRDCETARRIMGVDSLRQLTTDDLPWALNRLPDDVLRRRLRHVVTENARVVSTVELLRSGAVSGIGRLLTASHESLRDDYEVSCPELDLAVDTALTSGALGARMTGGGFGGSVIGLVPVSDVSSVISAIDTAFMARGFTQPVPRVVSPSRGAAIDSPNQGITRPAVSQLT